MTLTVASLVQTPDLLKSNKWDLGRFRSSWLEITCEQLTEPNFLKPVFRASNFTNDELLQILSYVDCRKMNMSKSLLNFYATNPALFKDLARYLES